MRVALRAAPLLATLALLQAGACAHAPATRTQRSRADTTTSLLVWTPKGADESERGVVHEVQPTDAVDAAALLRQCRTRAASQWGAVAETAKGGDADERAAHSPAVAFLLPELSPTMLSVLLSSSSPMPAVAAVAGTDVPTAKASEKVAAGAAGAALVVPYASPLTVADKAAASDGASLCAQIASSSEDARQSVLRELAAKADSPEGAVIVFGDRFAASRANRCIKAVSDALSPSHPVFALAAAANVGAGAKRRRQLSAAGADGEKTEPWAHYTPPSGPRPIWSPVSGPTPYYPLPLEIDETYVHTDPQMMAALVVGFVVLGLLVCATNHALDLRSHDFDSTLAKQHLLAKTPAIGKDNY